MLEDELLAQGMEDALVPPSRAESEAERWDRYKKANTYTLADKYKMALDEIKKR